ncbi:MAG TPA: neutral/alkaline non-lysosomal ceramidase N-terminal domain-containing protein, partial [Planctomycetaceae bacterium]|nr:neutral/alkaline non-lysosomal ceramidase N-terminal domain-containing protein [Planctomycetaceae bacterium]
MRIFMCGSFVVILSMTAIATAAEPSGLRAGAATSNITPELGTPIVGGFAPYPATHVHDELHARCLVLDDGKTKLALVVCDLLGFHRAVSEAAREQIEQITGIPKSHVLISATHTHSAGTALGEKRYSAEQRLDPYQQFVAKRIADGVRRALVTLRPAEVAAGTVDVPEHVFNRRWSMKPGTMPENPFGKFDQVKMNPPAGSANLLDPAGPTDPQVSLIAAREPDGKPIGVFATYSLHYVGGVGDGHISADYFAVFANRLAQLMNAEHQDPPFVAMMANGTSGDINNINFRTPRPGKKPYEQMRYVAEDVAAKVSEQLPKLTYRRDIKLAARYREPTVKWRRPTDDERAWATKTLETRPNVPGKVDLSRIYAERTLALVDLPETTTVPLQLLAIGDARIGTMPCETFCEIGLEFRKSVKSQPAFM